MTTRALPLGGVVVLALALTGCAGISTETSEGSSSSSESATASSSSSSSSSREETPTRATADARRAESSNSSSSSAGAAAAPTARSDAEAPRSTWRTERETQRAERDGRPTGNADTAKLVEQLNEATRELATLRAANAKLRAERAQPASSAPAAVATAPATIAPPKPDPADEKLAATLKSYTQFRQEITNLFSELERLRKENSGVSGQLKTAVDQVEQTRTALGKLENELRTEKRARADAEQTIAQLRERLQAVARALSSAGLSVDKLAGSETKR